MAAIITKKPEAPKTPQAPEQKSLDLSQVFKKKEGKGGCYYIESPDQGITFTIVGTIGKKLEGREKAGRPVKDVEEFLLNWFPVELTNQLEQRQISLVQAYGFMSTQRGTKVSNYSKKMSQGERLARILAGVSGSKSPEEMTEELIGLIKDHRTAAEAMLATWAEKNGRSPKGGFIRVNAVKTK